MLPADLKKAAICLGFRSLCLVRIAQLLLLSWPKESLPQKEQQGKAHQNYGCLKKNHKTFFLNVYVYVLSLQNGGMALAALTELPLTFFKFRLTF